MSDRKNRTSAYKRVISLILALFGAMAITSSGYAVPSDQGFMTILKGELGGMGLPTVLIFVGLSVFYLKCPIKYYGKRNWIIWALAVLFGVFALTGQSFISNGSWDLLFGSAANFVVGFIMLIGETYLFYRLIYSLFRYLDGRNNEVRGDESFGCKLKACLQKHPFISSWILFIILWLPYSLAFLPGCINNDDLQNITALLQGGTCQEVSTMPLYLLLIPFYKLGAIISDNAGLLLMSRVTCLASSACCAGVYAIVSKWDVGKLVKRGVLIFYGIIPLVGPYSMVVRKDTFYAAVLGLYAAKAVDMYLAIYSKSADDDDAEIPKSAEKNRPTFIGQIVAIALLSVAVCVTRPNGIYVIVVSNVLLTISLVCKTVATRSKSEKKNDKRVFIAPIIGALASLVLYLLVGMVFSGYQTQGTLRREMNGLMFQQTARYIRDYSDEVTPEEKSAISAVLDCEYISAAYDPELHDPVKYTFKLDATDAEWDAYKKVWSDMLKKHPGCYVNALVGNCFGYLDPFHYHSPQGSYTWNVENDGDTYSFALWMPQGIRSLVTNLVMLWAKVPVLGQLIWCGTYSWIIMLCIGYAIYRKKYSMLLLFAAPILSIAVCLISPVNGSIRYMLPVIEMTPAFVCLSLVHDSRTQQK